MPTFIDPFYSNRLLSIKLNFVSPIVSLVHKIKGKIKFTLHTGIFASINQDLGKTLIMIEGLNTHISKSLNEDIPEQDYIRFTKSLNRYRAYYHLMESVNFFDIDITKELANSILTEMYDIEYKLKNNVYKNKESDGSDRELIEFASKYSYNTAIQLTN